MPPIYLIHQSTRSNDVVNLNWKRCSGVNLIKVKSLLKLHLFSFHLFVSFTTSRVNYFSSYFHCHLNLIHTFHEKHRICTHLRMKIILDTCKKIALGKLSFFHFQTKLAEFFTKFGTFCFYHFECPDWWRWLLVLLFVECPLQRRRWCFLPECRMITWLRLRVAFLFYIHRSLRDDHSVSPSRSPCCVEHSQVGGCECEVNVPGDYPVLTPKAIHGRLLRHSSFHVDHSWSWWFDVVENMEISLRTSGFREVLPGMTWCIILIVNFFEFPGSVALL